MNVQYFELQRKLESIVQSEFELFKAKLNDELSKLGNVTNFEVNLGDDIQSAHAAFNLDGTAFEVVLYPYHSS